MSNTFLSEFLLITNIHTVLMIFLLIGVFLIISKMSKKLKFNKLMITSIFIGLILGIFIQAVAKFPDDPTSITWINEVTAWYGLFGNGFMDLLKMIVVPLVLVSIIRVIMNMKDDNLGKLTFRSMSMFFVTTAIAAIIAIVVANLFKLGTNLEVVNSSNEVREIVSLPSTIRGLLPSNPVQAMAEGNTVAVVVFAVFLGLAIRRLRRKYMDIIKPFIDLVEAFYKIIVSVAITVIKMMPYAVVPLMASTIASRGVKSLLDVTDFILALYISVVIMFLVHIIIIAASGMNPITYIKNSSKALILAFTSRSSLGTLPVTMEVLTDNLNVDLGTASFVTSLGSNMGMNGCAGIYPALVSVMIANMAGVQMNFTFYVMLIIVITISSLGIAGIPGTATMAVSVVISGMGMASYFPLAGAIIAIDPILDMGRTMLNVNGAMTAAVAVDNSLNRNNKKESKVA
ncbi:MAG: cation:dicarboxylase symporter family transporter [Clostridiales bacterium]|uniref:cation:dicarboxylate symporter family transporter n=1 Tax=Terrisporobacter sp. TaxID=1965305 RepID=UPI002A585E34|nr:cation:dicarboxylase symporter family transporter [Terrisporobacter sp.]MDD7754821.1 cation:dicarboxylase symporter family transporter [Clostridiales bacterium]MDY4135269.1 cation:dicarboxylase symporter family transporter [Terrisporobacter sp.]